MSKKFGKRRRARIYALQGLHAQKTTDYSLEKTLYYLWKLKNQPTDTPKSDAEELICDYNIDDDLKAFTKELLQTTLEKLDEIDSLISTTASHWDFSRIAFIDKNILRLAIAELLFIDGIPPKVTINEAIEIAKEFSSEKSGKFVNGVLDKIKSERLKQTKKRE